MATLAAAAQYVDVPGYAALMLRENFADLNHPESWIPLSKSWWMNTGARWHSSERRWTFPSGATITFGYLERDDDVYQYDTAAFQMIGIDELTQHTEKRYTFMFGRLRRPKEGPLSRVPIRMRTGSNPGNKGHAWVKRRFIDPQTREPGAVFVSAKLEDNPHIDADEYRKKSLSKLDPITRAQREKGDWDAHEGGRFKREWFKRWERWGGGYRVRAANGEWRYIERLKFVFQTCDPAASEKKTADWTVLSTWGLTDRWELFWLDCCRWQKEIPDLPGLIEAEYKRWQPKFVAIERVGANSAVYQLCLRLRMFVKPLDPLGQDKLVRATSAMVLAETGRLYLPQTGLAAWLDDAETELTLFTGDPKKDAHDDIVDTLSYAAACFEPGGEEESSKPGFRSSW